MAYSRSYVQVKANKESIHRRHIIVRKCPRKQKKWAISQLAALECSAVADKGKDSLHQVVAMMEMVQP